MRSNPRPGSYRLCCITIELAFRGDAVLRGVVAVVALIIKGSSYALIVRGNHTRSKDRAMIVMAMVHFGDGVGLNEVLIGIADVVNDTKVRLQDRVLVSERRIEFELVAQRGSARSYVVSGRNVDLVEHIVIEVVLVWADARFLVGYTPSAVTRLFIPFSFCTNA